LNGLGQGDPAQSVATAVEQYRVKYIFLAPQDYDVNFVDVVQPLTAQVTLDGAQVNVSPTPISSNYGVARVQLGAGNGGAHVLTSTEPVGIQVLGYGSYTSYQYPGGSNLDAIALPTYELAIEGLGRTEPQVHQGRSTGVGTPGRSSNRS
jgi:hypothetical protein